VAGEVAMDIETVTIPTMRVAAVRHIGPYNEIKEAFGRLMDFARGPNLIPPGPPIFLALYHDSPMVVPAAQLRSDAALVVREDVEASGDAVIASVPGGKYARVRYVGPYEGIGQAWANFMEAFSEAEYHIGGDGLTFDMYMNNPQTTPPEKLITDLYVQIS
jgi:AraC family transcriptional regulator